VKDGRVDRSAYDPIAAVYDDWTATYRPDVDFYVSAASGATGPVVELGVGTGRIAVPTALAGRRVIGVDSSTAMLDRCRRNAREAGVGELIDLRPGDFRSPPVPERVDLVTCPYRALSHLHADADRRQALAAVHDLLTPGGRFVFDVFTASDTGVEFGRRDWTERAPEVWDRDRWDPESRALSVSVRGPTGETELSFACLPRQEWRALLEEAGFEVFACYGWFDHSPCAREGLTIWVARRAAAPLPEE
jgi:SAM-dependent methyltransferase